MKGFSIKKALLILAGLVLAWFLFVQNGGDTITILNQSAEDICEVYFSYDGVQGNWGRNRVSKIQYPHSRDIRLPLYFEWFADDKAAGYDGLAVSCEGEVLDKIEGIGGDGNFYVWEVR